MAKTLVLGKSDNDCFTISLCDAWILRSTIVPWSLQLDWTASRSPRPTKLSSR